VRSCGACVAGATSSTSGNPPSGECPSLPPTASVPSRLSRLADILVIWVEDVTDASDESEGSFMQVILPLNGPDAALAIGLDSSAVEYLRELANLAAYVVQSKKDDSGSWPTMTASRSAEVDLEIRFEPLAGVSPLGRP